MISPICWWGAGALGLSLLAVTVGWQLQVAQMRLDHATALASERKLTQGWKDSHGQLEAAVAKQREDQLAQRLAEEQKRIEDDAKQRDEQARLRRLAAEQQALAKQLGEELLRRLEATPKEPESKLDGGTRTYYRELRRQQCAAATSAGRAAAGCAEGGRVP